MWPRRPHETPAGYVPRFLVSWHSWSAHWAAAVCGECAAVCVCEQIARKRRGDKGFKNGPAPARQTSPKNPEKYTFRFPQHKKWLIQNSWSKVGRSFFGKKGQGFLDSIRSGLAFFFPKIFLTLRPKYFLKNTPRKKRFKSSRLQ